MRTKRKTNQNNLVILCEGTETEFTYFTEAKQFVEDHYPHRFSKIKIVPVHSERIMKKNPKRKSIGPLKKADATPWHYYCMEETSEEEYNKYKAQPVRYVRETQLYMEREGYNEGWAVFDREGHPAHPGAFALANSVPNLHIAFSSYSFEEWFLVHFEKNKTAFQSAGSLIERLRLKNYIPDYTKNMKGLFRKYTLPMKEKAFTYAAWTRTLSPDAAIYERNPYTDVDRLMERLLG